MSEKKPEKSVKERAADRRYQATIDKVTKDFSAGVEREKAEHAKMPVRHPKGEGVREPHPFDQDKHLK